MRRLLSIYLSLGASQLGSTPRVMYSALCSLFFMLVLFGTCIGFRAMSRESPGSNREASTLSMGSNNELPRSSLYEHRLQVSRVLTRALGAAAIVSSGGLSGANTGLAVEGGLSGGPKITDKVRLEIKIANYTEESIGKNRGAAGSGDLVIGLYGEAAPQACRLFLDTVYLFR